MHIQEHLIAADSVHALFIQEISYTIQSKLNERRYTSLQSACLIRHTTLQYRDLPQSNTSGENTQSAFHFSGAPNDKFL